MKLSALFFILLMLLPSMGLADPLDEFVVLSYHDVRDSVTEDAKTAKTDVSTANLVKQFNWLKQEGYHIIAVEDLLQAQAGNKHLPDKAVLLSFDDGYGSFFTTVFPLLKKFQYPALVAVVGKWMETHTLPASGQQETPARDSLLTWDQLKAMQQSGLVEIGSHSYDLHRGILGNPQGNLQPAGVTRLYDPSKKTYETDEAYRQRIRLELKAASDSLLVHTGQKSRVMVWPYGEANQLLIQEANKQGMSMTFGLGDKRNSLADLPFAHRMLVTGNPELANFSKMMSRQRTDDRPLHVVHVDLDYIHDNNPEQTERNLGLLLDRIQAMGVNTVYLQAFADPDGDGNADALYFPNRHLPMTEDLFNRAAWQLLTRTRVKVYAWMPVLAFQVKRPESWFVHEWIDAKITGNQTLPQLIQIKDNLLWKPDKAYLSKNAYRRLSPFNPDAKRLVGEIYEDLATHCQFAGILFHDDALLTDYEDVTPQALRAVDKQWKLPVTQKELRENPTMLMKWAKHKTQLLIEWTDYLASKVRYYHPDIKTARNYYALPIMQPESEAWFAQSLESGLAAYDYVAIEAMPFMEKADNPNRWLEELVTQVARHPNGLKKTVFELQTVDWNTHEKVPMEIFAKQLQLIQSLGAINIGYYPDNVFENHPRQEDMEKAFALPEFP